MYEINQNETKWNERRWGCNVYKQRKRRASEDALPQQCNNYHSYNVYVTMT